jgi:glutamine amidotransferase
MIGIINYKMGNISSISYALEYFNISYDIINYYDCFNIDKFNGYILPGVGSFTKAMDIIKNFKIDVLLNEEFKKNKPILGICLGMQLLFSDSLENGYTKGLGFIEGNVVKFNDLKGYRIPHVGWNNVYYKDDILFSNIPQNNDFYFDHSFYVKTEKKYILGETKYVNTFPSAIKKNNIYGVQFHPEKSQLIGIEVLHNFSKLC